MGVMKSLIGASGIFNDNAAERLHFCSNGSLDEASQLNACTLPAVSNSAATREPRNLIVPTEAIDVHIEIVSDFVSLCEESS
jgi:hypothetical protein